ncbi:MAG: beta domain [Geminicoccaceae bacterium]|jgi:hypothetical protein|nr:beta domain [Geminicoccaceae bacterium]
MNRLVAVSLFAAAAVAIGACARTDAPTGPDAATRAVMGQGASLEKGESSCPKPTPRPSREVQLEAIPYDPVPMSIPGGAEVNVLFTNATCEVLDMIWVRRDGTLQPYAPLQPGGSSGYTTYVGHAWLFKKADGTPYAAFRIEDHASGAQEVYLGCTKGKNAVCN